VHCHHVGKIVGANSDTPAIPIEESNVIAAIFGQETIPDVRVSLNSRDVAMGVIAGKQTGRCREQSFVKVVPRARQAIADPDSETLQFVP